MTSDRQFLSKDTRLRGRLIRYFSVLSVVLAGCGPSTVLTRSPFLEVSWVVGKTQTASAGENIAWWQYGVRDSVITMSSTNKWGDTRGDTLLEGAITQGVRIEVGFNGVRDGQLAIRYREYYQAGSLQSPDDNWHARDRFDNLMYFDVSKDSTLTVHGVPITVVSASPSVLTYIVGGMPKRDESLLPPPGRGPGPRSG